MFQFNGQTDAFPLDNTEFASTDFGFSQGMTGSVTSSVFEQSSSNIALGSGNALESNGAGTLMENSVFIGSNGSSDESSNQGHSLAHNPAESNNSSNGNSQTNSISAGTNVDHGSGSNSSSIVASPALEQNEL
ncbi:hypothetical protein BG011_008426, partial [Mortierella polycephala]